MNDRVPQLAQIASTVTGRPERSPRNRRAESSHRASRPAARLAVREVRNLSVNDNHDIGKALAILLVANCAARPSLDVASCFAGRRRAPDCALDSTLLQVGNQLHIIAQLVDACTDIPILTRTFTGQAHTIRHVLSAIAWTIANDIEGTLDRPRDALTHARAS
jgi:hypothetical protein